MTPTPTRGVLITCLDRERHLRFTLKTIREMREEFGEDALAKGIQQEAIAKLLWYGLKHEDAELTPDQVEEMVDLEHLGDVMEAVAKATGRRATIEVVEEEADPQLPATETTSVAPPEAAGEPEPIQPTPEGEQPTPI